jgi:hypothetical protein
MKERIVLTVEIEFLYPDNPLVVSPNCCRVQLEDEVPDLSRLKDFLKKWFAEKIETDLSMVRVWCLGLKYPTVLLPKTVWNSEAKLIVGQGVPQAISEALFQPYRN